MAGLVLGIIFPLPLPVSSAFTDTVLHDTYTVVGSIHFGLGIAGVSFVIGTLMVVFSKPLGKLLAKGIGSGTH